MSSSTVMRRAISAPQRNFGSSVMLNISRAGPSTPFVIARHRHPLNTLLQSSCLSTTARPRPALDLLPKSSLLPLRLITTSPRSLFPSSSQALYSTATNATSDSLRTTPPEPEPQGAYAKFKALSKKYGWYAIIMYLLLSTVDFSLSFLAVHSIGAEHIEPILHSAVQQYRIMRHGEEKARELELEDQVKKEEAEKEERKEMELEKKDGKKNGKSGFGSRALWAEIALAYAIHKTALLPFRAGLTVAWTPKVVAWLTRRGWVGKGGVTRAATHAQEKMKDASSRVKDIASRARTGPN